MRTALAAAGLALVLAGVAGCSDGGDPPTNASQDEFCDAFNGLVDDVLESGVDDSDATVEAIKDWADEIEDVGTPQGMPDDARHGFELFVEQAGHLEKGMGLEDLQNLGTDLSEDDQADGTAFTEWTQENCPVR